MAKRKRVYVPPVGKPLPEPPETNLAGERWLWISECCLVLSTWIPFGSEPETITWSDPYESIRNERDEKLNAEYENRLQVKEAFESLLENWSWPDTSEEVSWITRSRLEWCKQVATIFAGWQKTSDSPCLGAPRKSIDEILTWMMFSLYSADVVWPKRWWDSSSFEDYYS